MTESFKELPYEYDSLEPYIDEKTMKIHHDKHHKAYFDKFITAIKNSPKLDKKTVGEILSNLNEIPENIKNQVINNGGGFYNHNFFWEILKKDTTFSNKSEIGKAIIQTFQNYENFKEQFSNAALALFGSGWTWLVLDKTTGKIEIIQTKNQECPLSINKMPLIALDVWEHAYYLKYQNKRAEYIEAFFSIINWEKVNKIFMESVKH